MGSTNSQSERRLILARLVLALAAAGIFLAIGLNRIDGVAREGVVGEAICDQLLHNTTEGRQALVSSAWWPPLPTLARLPFAAVLPTGPWPVASLLVSAVFGAACLVLLERIVAHWNLGWTRFVMVASLAAHPAFFTACTNGSSGTLVIFLALLTAFGLIQWVESRKLRFLVYLATGSALLTAASLELVPWVLLVFCVFLADLAAFAPGMRHREGAVILAFLPAVYTAGLWTLMNWLIMGDPLYFVRPLLVPVQRDMLEPLLPANAPLSTYIVAAVAFGALLLSDLTRHRAGLIAGALALAVLATAMIFSLKRPAWDPRPALLCVFPLSLLAVGYAAGILTRLPKSLKPAVACLPLALSIGAILETRLPLKRLEAEDLQAIMLEREMVLPKVEHFVLADSPYARVFVCGYDSFALLGKDASPLFVHSLDFNFYKAKNDYVGQRLYVLTRRPVGRGARDSIHWKFDRMYALGSRDTLYAGDWGDWRLFEIIQAPRSAP